jgi:glycosyltransferase involved in cell wall biosynthesis
MSQPTNPTDAIIPAPADPPRATLPSVVSGPTQTPVPRVGVLCIHPAPYRDPVYRELAKRGHIQLLVMVLYSLDRGHREWELSPPDYPHMYLGHRLPPGKSEYIPWGILSTLRHAKFDVLVVPGYRRPATMLAIVYALWTRTPLIIEADSIRCLQPDRGWKRAVLRWLFRRAAALRVPGQAAREYMESYGAPPAKVCEGAYCLDVHALRQAIDRCRPERTAWRQTHGIPDDAFVFLTVANMIPSRRHQLLCQVLLRLAPETRAHLVIVGSGAERDTLRRLAQADAGGRIHILDPVPFDQLPILYAGSDAYVHSGTEPFATAMEIAALAGMPIVATDRIGYVDDLRVRGAAPLLSNLDDADALYANMARLLADPPLRADLGQRAQRAALTRTPPWAAEQLERTVLAIRHADA